MSQDKESDLKSVERKTFFVKDRALESIYKDDLIIKDPISSSNTIVTDAIVGVNNSSIKDNAQAFTQSLIFQPSSIWKRQAAWFIDALPFLFFYYVISNKIVSLSSLNVASYIDENIVDTRSLLIDMLSMLSSLFTLAFVMLIIWAVYNITLEKFFSTTYGKYLIGIRVIKSDDINNTSYKQKITPLSFKDCTLRFFSAGISWIFFNIGHSFIYIRQDKASLHDLLSKTKVVDDKDIDFPGFFALSKEAQRFCFIISLVVQFFLLVILTSAFFNQLVKQLNSI